MVGCVLYTLSYFTHPFVDSNAIGIASGVYRFPKHPEETQYQVSEKMKDLIRNFLTPNPLYRPNTAEAIQIINNWYTSSEVPLNVNQPSFRKRQDAGRRRKRQNSMNSRFLIEELLTSMAIFLCKNWWSFKTSLKISRLLHKISKDLSSHLKKHNLSKKEKRKHRHGLIAMFIWTSSSNSNHHSITLNLKTNLKINLNSHHPAQSKKVSTWILSGTLQQINQWITPTISTLFLVFSQLVTIKLPKNRTT